MEGVEKRELSSTVNGNVNWHSHYGKGCKFLKKLKIVTISSSNPTPGLISKIDENSSSKRYTHPKVHCSNIYNSQDTEVT